MITNVFLFIPVGFLFKLYRRGKIDPYFLITFGAGILISFNIECAQLFLPGRYTQPMDVVTNGSGAWLGALLFKLLEKQLVPLFRRLPDFLEKPKKKTGDLSCRP
jgi:glycopeptide antibiotics resistance protein